MDSRKKSSVVCLIVELYDCIIDIIVYGIPPLSRVFPGYPPLIPRYNPLVPAPWIISASRRTDLPAFYARWFIQQVRRGFCEVANPFNPQQVRRVSLLPPEVTAIVFWTRHPRPLLPYLPELDQAGFRYYFHYTLLDYPRLIETHRPSLSMALRTFRDLAQQIGPERVIWRYDPIVLSNLTPVEFHLEAFSRLAQALRGSTRRVVISLLDPYPKLKRRFAQMEQAGLHLQYSIDGREPWLAGLLHSLAECAAASGMEIVSCAEPFDLRPYGVWPGSCIDSGLLNRLFSLALDPARDPGQRPACGCALSVDIGWYDSCPFGCQYCYATRSFTLARQNVRRLRQEIGAD